MRTGASHLKRHNIARLCTNHGCVDVTDGAGGPQVIGGHQLSQRGMKQIISGMRGAASYHPTLPPEIATDAAVYVAVIVVFYAAIIILLVGTNLHRLRRRRRNRPSHHRHLRPVDTTASAEVSMSMMSIFSSSSSSSAENPGPVSTSVVTEKSRWGEHEDAVVV